MYDLNTLAVGSGWTFSSAVGINNAGQIVGTGINPSGQDGAAFLYTNGSVRDLGSLGGGYTYPHAINNSGWVVRSCNSNDV